MRRNELSNLMEIAFASAALGAESVRVIGLRLAGVAIGGSQAADEMWRMWSEKVLALAELQTRLLNGSLGSTPSVAVKETLNHYRGKVAANRRRLGKSA